MSPPNSPRIYVLAGVTARARAALAAQRSALPAAHYYNPDEAARTLMAANPALTQADANSAAWRKAVELLTRAIGERKNFAFETTLGANTIPRLLMQAASQGIELYVWYVGLTRPELHIERVRARVRRGGHDIAVEHIDGAMNIAA